MAYARLLETAIDHFGRHGFEGASTRDIAKASGTAMSSITYHFGGKQGLYLAAAQHIGEQVAARLSNVCAMARAAVSGTRDDAVEGLLGFVAVFAQMMLNPQSAIWAQFISREQQDPTDAFSRIYNTAICGVIEIVTALVARARPDLDERKAEVTAFLLMGQALSMRLARATMCRQLNISSIDTATEQLLLERLAANCRSILTPEPS